MFAVMLAAISTAMEMVIVVKSPRIKRLFTKRTFIGLTFSFALSYAIGAAFGGVGLIAMTAAVLSTLISYIIYEADLFRWMNARSWSAFKASVAHNWMLFVKTIRLGWRIFTAPIRMMLWVAERAKRAKAKVIAALNWARAKRAHT